LAASYADPKRGFELEEVNGGFQLRTKVDNMNYLKGMLKVKPFKLSGPALEVLSIVAYKQPMIKSEIDDIRGVESGHLLRALMEKRLVAFAGKSDLPGKPMTYETTRKFLEIFGLRNLKELPSLAEIDDLIPEGIGDEEENKSLGDMTEELSEEVKAASYSEGEEELGAITDQLANINTSSEFFEQEKARMKAKKEAEKAQDIRDALEVGEEVAAKDKSWLEKYDQRLAEEAAAEAEAQAAEGPAEANSFDETELHVEFAAVELDANNEQDSQGLSVSESAELDEAIEASDSVSTEAKEEILTAEEMMEFSADPAELTDVAGEPEQDLESAIERFDSEDSQQPEKIGSVNVEDLAADLAIFDEEPIEGSEDSEA
jgi:segregation and condensation protein B